jgi:hypothetical protein
MEEVKVCILLIIPNFGRVGYAFLAAMQGYTERHGQMVGISFVYGGSRVLVYTRSSSLVTGFFL